MIVIVLRYLGGIRIEKGISEQRLELDDGCTLLGLKSALATLGLDPEDKEVAFLLDGNGFAYFSPDHKLASGQVVTVFPLISGG